MRALVRTARFVVAALALAACGGSTALSGSGGQGGGGGQPAASGAQKLAIGSPCTADADCGSAPFFCLLAHPGGYCMRRCDIAKGDADCPSESICQFDGQVGECHRTCGGASDCRQGYVCSPAVNDATGKASHAFCDAADMGGMGGGGAGGMGMGSTGKGGG
jgi:hypothetical protein